MSQPQQQQQQAYWPPPALTTAGQHQQYIYQQQQAPPPQFFLPPIGGQQALGFHQGQALQPLQQPQPSSSNQQQPHPLCHHPGGPLGVHRENINKLKKMGKKLFNKEPKQPVFVPAPSAASPTGANLTPTTGAPPPLLSHSVSYQPESPNLQSRLMAPGQIDQRRISAPATDPYRPGPSFVGGRVGGAPPPPTLPNLAPLTINTYGGEVAGQGYGWLAEDTEEDTGVESISIAQNTKLRMVKERMAELQSNLKELKEDEQAICDLIAQSYQNEMLMDEQELRNSVAQLEMDIEGLRVSYPKAVPPKRPPRPGQAGWTCLRCLLSNSSSFYRCAGCKFPRPAINPADRLHCNCEHCSRAVGVNDHVFVSLSECDGDWTMINRLNPA